ncbi:ABC transporter ATP-binding protein [Cellulomonas aerilata]|uniref:ABC transporter ATP-binding protein n=1 Tax=Cellulomonas aerilata TaxID=515326 RepID=UPI0011BFD853|nr:ABC transporter ATP-binding protein [Cellulomonas aerilata]
MGDRPTDPVVRADSLLVGYGGEPVCAPVTFDLPAGTALALVGPNGSGKSTVLRAVLGLLTPADGVLHVLGREVDEREHLFRAEVAGVLDDDAYFPALTVAEHLVLTARGHGVPDAEGVVDELLEDFGLAGHADVLPVTLSSGQRRRLLLAAGFARPRRLLVLDEPEQRLDQRMRSALAARLRAETAAGGAVLLATHDPALLAAVADAAVLVGEDESPVLDVPEAVRAIRAEPPR